MKGSSEREEERVADVVGSDARPAVTGMARTLAEPVTQVSGARRARGIALMSLAVLCFAVLDTTVKYLSRHYAVSSLVWVRYAVQMLVLLAFSGPRMKLDLVRTSRPGLQLLRALLLLGTTLFFVNGLRYIPLGEATAIIYLTPLIVTALSVPLLGERIDRHNGYAVLAGFAGVLVIVRPGSALLTLAVLLPLAAAVCNSLYQITTRQLSGTEHPTTTNFITGLVGAVLMSATLPLAWITPTPLHALMMLGMGLVALGGHYLLTRAFECASPAAVAPFSYGQILWAVLLGWWAFDSLPDAVSMLGIAIIAASGLYTAYRQRRRTRSTS